MTEYYKCPKCSMWDDGIIVEKDKLRCSECDYVGTTKEFTAKQYYIHVQLIVRVLAFDKNDAKKEFESFKEDFQSYDHEMIRIEESKE